ncbi:microfibril-associated glycoprotein 4-like [Penaeus monodon]|uniref:microfibril-associated glycoprotein 4-like n=1 Tax=Penaeus monodon TaxID=6687 RepID=UPI0018A77606|nr:microfibril-associated glycoprotein 4-like [Penaeus monodon]
MVTDGGGWTVIQRRIPKDIHEDFNRPWADYRQGFGELSSEFWLGLEALHQLTLSSDYELRVDMKDFEFGSKYAVYGVFRVGPESDGYRLTATHYSGNAGDALSVFHSGRKFSTFDRDQDTARNRSCAREKEGGWWFHACYAAHLNGVYPDEPQRLSSGPEIRWWSNQDHVLVLNSVEMKIRRIKGFIPPSSTPADAEDTGIGVGESAATSGVEDSGVTPRVNPGEDERMDYDYHWEAGNEVITFGDISGDVEDEYNVTDHHGRSDVSPWGVAKTQGNTEG